MDWNLPTSKTCPKCGAPTVLRTARRGRRNRGRSFRGCSRFPACKGIVITWPRFLIGTVLVLVVLPAAGVTVMGVIKRLFGWE